MDRPQTREPEAKTFSFSKAGRKKATHFEPRAGDEAAI